MTYTTPRFGIGPAFTPEPIKMLLILIASASVLFAFTNNFITYIFEIPGPLEWFSLSWWGMEHYLWWEPLTFMFTHHPGYGGTSLSFFLTLGFNLLLIWTFGTDLYTRVGNQPFFTFYFFCGIFAGLFTFLLMPLTGFYGTISGATPAVIALLVAWTLINPEAEILLFFLIPIKAKWLTLGTIGIILLSSFSSLDVVSFTLYFTAATTAYIYSLIIWGLHSPFPRLYPFELWVVRTSEKVRSLGRFFQTKGKKEPKSKVVHLMTGVDIENDDKFIDAMLEKISHHGEYSLTWKERERMEQISSKRRR